MPEKFTPPPTLTEPQNTSLLATLKSARAREDADDPVGALELYTQYQNDLLKIRGIKPETVENFDISHLQSRFVSRFADRRLPSPLIETPSIPDLKPEHLQAISEIFGPNNLEPATVPKPEYLNDQYFTVMYPPTQTEPDKTQGLISHHPGWWDQSADKSLLGPSNETWGQAYIRSMQAEATTLTDTLLYTESIQKPNYTNGSQHYSTKEKSNRTSDPLLLIIQEVFGNTANRFNLTHDQITTTLIPKIKEKIQKKLTTAKTTPGSPIPSFDVIITPALINNLNTTLRHPENSQTNTSEWTSTPLLKQDNTDSGDRLMVGDSDDGGAGCVRSALRGGRWVSRGFRLSVVFKTKS